MNPTMRIWTPTWSIKPGVIFKMIDEVTVVDEDNEIVIIPEMSLLMTCGAGTFIFMETHQIFRVDELDARIIEYSSELLSQ